MGYFLQILNLLLFSWFQGPWAKASKGALPLVSQRAAISALASCRCPLFPDTVTGGAEGIAAADAPNPASNVIANAAAAR